MSVADQFVGADNDAVFKCQLAPQVRDLFQVVGWLEDGQHLGGSSPVASLMGQLASPTWLEDQEAAPLGRRQQHHHQHQRVLVLPDGQLYIRRAQVRDANKSYRCQIKNLLSGRLSLSPIGGRLFVTGE